jgi:hypothetical protein
MADEPTLRDRARAAIRARKLPSRRPDCARGAPGTGETCVICGESIKRGQMLFEIQFFAPSLSAHHFHLRCFAAWEFECTKGKGSGRGRPLI